MKKARKPVADVPPNSPRSKLFQFQAVFGEIWRNHMLPPPRWLSSPPWRNPGSATGGTSQINSKVRASYYNDRGTHFNLHVFDADFFVRAT